MKFTSSWSGGKDSALAFLFAQSAGHIPVSLINIMNERGGTSRAHGLPLFILQLQARAMQLPLLTSAASWEQYTPVLIDALNTTKTIHQATAILFGDIDLQYHLDWEQSVAAQAHLHPLWPLKNMNRLTVAKTVIKSGIKAVIVSVKDNLSADWLGKEFNNETLAALISEGIDPCGEDGSFHTFVYDAPFFLTPVRFSKGIVRHEDGHLLLTLNPSTESQI